MKNRKNRQLEVADALEILGNVLQEREQAIMEFEKGGQDVKFAQVKSIGPEPIEISKGVLVHVYEVVNEKYFILKCKMEDKAELNRHMHSDYGEGFDPSFTEEPIKLVFKKGEPVNIFKNAAGDSYYQYSKNEGGPEELSSPPGIPVARIVPVVDMPLTVIQDSKTVATIVEGSDFQNYVKVSVVAVV